MGEGITAQADGRVPYRRPADARTRIAAAVRGPDALVEVLEAAGPGRTTVEGAS